MATAKKETTKTAGTDVAVKKENPVAAVYDYGEDAGGGFDNQTSSDYKIPFLDILQSNSPELNTNEALRAGMIFNRTTSDAFSGKDGIIFVPAHTEHCFTEWVPREKGGGYVGRYETDDPAIANAKRNPEKKGKLIHSQSNNDLVETFYVFGVMLSPEGIEEQCVIAFTSTKIGIYRAWMTKARQQQIVLDDGRRMNVPLWGHRFRIRTQLIEKNNYKWHNFVINFDGEDAKQARLAVNDPLYQAAKATNQSVRSGMSQADFSRQGGNDDTGNEGGSGGGNTDEDIPF